MIEKESKTRTLASGRGDEEAAKACAEMMLLRRKVVTAVFMEYSLWLDYRWLIVEKKTWDKCFIWNPLGQFFNHSIAAVSYLIERGSKYNVLQWIVSCAEGELFQKIELGNGFDGLFQVNGFTPPLLSFGSVRATVPTSLLSIFFSPTAAASSQGQFPWCFIEKRGRKLCRDVCGNGHVFSEKKRHTDPLFVCVSHRGLQDDISA